MLNTTETATLFCSRIRANVEALYANQISFREFSQRNRKLWDEVIAQGPAVWRLVTETLAKESLP